jgi:hypothetical protein
MDEIYSSHGGECAICQKLCRKMMNEFISSVGKGAPFSREAGEGGPA